MEKGHYSVLRVSHLSQIDNFSIEQQKESDRMPFIGPLKVRLFGV